VHSYCVIPSNIPFVIQRDVLVYEQSDRRHDSLQTYITAVGRCFLWRIRTPNAFVGRRSNSDSTSNRYVTCFWLHTQVYWSFLLYIWIQSKEAINLEYYCRDISGQSGESLLFRLALAWQLQDVRCSVVRPTCAPATTRLTSQPVGTSTITYNFTPYIGSQTFLWFKFQTSSPVFHALYQQSAHFSDYFVNLFDVSTGHQRCF